jgi:hypothetical protein
VDIRIRKLAALEGDGTSELFESRDIVLKMTRAAKTASPVPQLQWESFVHRLPDGSRREGHRSAVPGGWVVLIPAEFGGGVFFYEDPSHRWTGDLLPTSKPAARGSAKAKTPRAPGGPFALTWEPFRHSLPGAAAREGYRAAVPGGWFVMLTLRPGGGAFFYRDPPHAWGADAIRALDSGATIIGTVPFARASTLLRWESFRHVSRGASAQDAYRASVPGGWFVLFPTDPGGGAFFYEDPTRAWE